MSQMVRKNYPELGEVKAPYVHSVKHGNTLYISGLTAFGTRAQQAGIGAQAEEVFTQIRTVARAEGIDFPLLSKSRSLSLLLMRSTSCAKCFTGTTAIIYPPARS